MNEAMNTQETAAEISCLLPNESYYELEDRTLGERYSPSLTTTYFVPDEPFEFKDVTLSGQPDYFPFTLDCFFPRGTLTNLALTVVRQTKNKEVAKEARKILSVIQGMVTIFENSGIYLDHIPRLDAANLEDGSLLIEWIFDDFRIGFSIEPDPRESGWYLVTKENLGGINATGHFSNHQLELQIFWLFTFVLSNSHGVRNQLSK